MSDGTSCVSLLVRDVVAGPSVMDLQVVPVAGLSEMINTDLVEAGRRCPRPGVGAGSDFRSGPRSAGDSLRVEVGSVAGEWSYPVRAEIEIRIPARRADRALRLSTARSDGTLRAFVQAALRRQQVGEELLADRRHCHGQVVALEQGGTYTALPRCRAAHTRSSRR